MLRSVLENEVALEVECRTLGLRMSLCGPQTHSETLPFSALALVLFKNNF